MNQETFNINNQVCKKLDNDHIAYITKQYLTILKAISFLTQIKSLNLTKTDVYKYVLDIPSILPDLSTTSQPLETTIAIFNPVKKVVGQNYVYTTVLNDYNKFLYFDYANLSPAELNSKIEMLKGKLNDTASRAYSILQDSCNDTGKFLGEHNPELTAQLMTNMGSLQKKLNEYKNEKDQNKKNSMIQTIIPYVSQYYPQILESVQAILQLS